MVLDIATFQGLYFYTLLLYFSVLLILKTIGFSLKYIATVERDDTREEFMSGVCLCKQQCPFNLKIPFDTTKFVINLIPAAVLLV